MPLYCDEAGNTGSNYVDENQPIHVLAGWLVPDSAMSSFTAAGGPIAERQQGQDEIKGARLITSGPGRRRIGAFFDAVNASGAHPVCVIVEKKYCACLKIIDTLLDPAHNERAAWLPVGADVMRRQLADWMLDVLPDSAIRTFAAAYRDPSTEAFAAAIGAIASACRFSGKPGVGVAIEGNLGALEELVRRETAAVLGVPQHVAKSINVFTFGAFIQRASALVASLHIDPPSLIHDESQEFRQALEELVSFYRAASGVPDMRLQSGRSYFPGIEHIVGFEMRVSDAELGLQAADVLATVVKDWSVSILRREEPRNGLGRILGGLLHRADKHPETLFWISSTEFADRWQEVARRFLPDAI